MPLINAACIDIPAERLNAPEGDIDSLALSLATLGLIHPLSVVANDELPGRYWLLAGRRRLMAARKLGWEGVLASVMEADDARREMITISENLHRSEIVGAQRDRAIARYAELFAAINPAARPSAITRMVKGPANGNGKHDAPPVPTVAQAVDIIAKNHGVAPRTVRAMIRRGDAIDDREAKILDAHGITVHERDRLAALPDADRTKAINLIAQGYPFDEAVGDGGDEDEGPTAEEAAAAELAAFLDSCPVRSKGVNLAAFDEDAGLYLAIRQALQHMKLSIGWEKTKKRLAHRGPYAQAVIRLLEAKHPRDWLKCHACNAGYLPGGAPCPKCRNQSGYLLS